jgi:hypothetical protein
VNKSGYYVIILGISNQVLLYRTVGYNIHYWGVSDKDNVIGWEYTCMGEKSRASPVTGREDP